MRKHPIRRTVYSVAVVVIAALAFVNAASAGGGATARTKLTLMAPASPGGGWDSFARENQQAMRANGVVNNVQVVNVPGAGGTIGLSQFVQMEGRNDMLMVTGGVMIGAIQLADSPETMEDIVPIARVSDDYAALVVPADSPYKTLEDFLTAWKKDPGGTSIAGGSLGSIDHLMTGLVAKKVGIDPEKVNYVAYSGGGEALTAMISGTTTAGMSGYNEVAPQIEAGNLRPLAISAPKPLPDIDVPTFKEQGVDASMANWRGVAAAPGITEEEKAEFVEIMSETRKTPEWQDALERNNWTDSFMTGDELDKFLDKEIRRTKSIVEDLGL
ncbi:Bug family tripartite tricarboxylate transporter substrate binding protein [Arthrobacter castelli]|uniref:Bug family tripartite tricarboxylate transporter substrate binding protein n=1 Tax=Arthrobacter castelli TaxID=271431 RepID=UPI000478F7F9|nr:tripartite tricarboxylate transporter substrate-binding protein [Arthrobacter castelli]